MGGGECSKEETGTIVDAAARGNKKKTKSNSATSPSTSSIHRHPPIAVLRPTLLAFLSFQFWDYYLPYYIQHGTTESEQYNSKDDETSFIDAAPCWSYSVRYVYLIIQSFGLV